jgi:glutamyl-tRNA synthetase
MGGDLILRIEDTDSHRFVPGAEEYIIESFDWLGIPFDEGPHCGGKHAPYRQSERKEIYKKYAYELCNKGFAYFAFDTTEALEQKRTEIQNFQYDASTRMTMTNSLTLTAQETQQLLESGVPYVIRIKVEPNEDIVIHDLIRGKVVINSTILDDKVLFKSTDGLPTYHLANIVDDHLMEISHVIRGEEWLPSAPLHVLLYRYFGWEMPWFAHLPLLLKPEGAGKLSKRDGDRLGFPVFPLEWKDPKTGETASGYRESGYLPEAVVNFLTLLGWNPGDNRELLSVEDSIALFSFDNCSKSGAKFDYKKAEWFNHQYIQLKPDSEIVRLFSVILKEKHISALPETIEQIVGLVKERINFIKDLWEQTAFFFIPPEKYDEKAVAKRWKPDSAALLTELCGVLEKIADFSAENTEEIVKQWIEAKQYPLGNIMNVFRLSLVGELKGPSIFNITEILGKEEVVRRVSKAIEILK